MSIFFTSGLTANPATPLTHPRIGWHNRATTANTSGSPSLSGFPVSNILNPGTYERYKPTTASFSVNVDLGSAQNVDYVATQTKNITTINVQYSDNGSTYISVLNETVDDNTNMFLFETQAHRYWRVTMYGAADPQVVALKLGLVLEMPRPIYSGHAPMQLNRSRAIRPNLSETGQFLGASQKRAGLRGNFEFKHLTADWYRSNFDPFAATNPRIAPFFIAWRPETFSEDVHYGWGSNELNPSNMGVKDYMSVSLSMEGFIDAE